MDRNDGSLIIMDQIMEVPVIEEVVREVNTYEVVEVEKIVPTYKFEFVDKEVQRKEIRLVDVTKIKEQVLHREIHIPQLEVIEIPVTKIRKIPIRKTRIIEQVIEKPGPIVEIDIPNLVDVNIVVPKFVPHLQPTVVAQKLKVCISTSNSHSVNVVVDEFVPRPVYEERFLPVPIGGVGTEFSEYRRTVAKKFTEGYHPVMVCPSQWNSLVNDMNCDLPNDDFEELLVDLTDNDDDITPELRKIFKFVPMVDPLGSIGMELLYDPPLNWGRKAHKKKPPVRVVPRTFHHDRGTVMSEHIAKQLSFTRYSPPRRKGERQTTIYA